VLDFRYSLNLIRISSQSDSANPGHLKRFNRLKSVLLAGILLELLSSAAAGQNFESSAFVLRNYSPFSAIIGIPGRWPDGTNNIAELGWNVSNHSFYENNGPESLLLDGETQTLSARLQHRFARRVQVGASLPWLNHSGGFMDSTIDNWHDITNLPEGIRPQLEQNDLNYIYNVSGVDLFVLDEPASGIGDLQIGLAIDLGALDLPATTAYRKRLGWRLNLNAELATGDADKLTGSGDTDVAAGVGVRSPKSETARIDWWVDMGIAWPGDVKIEGLYTSGQVFYYDAALAFQVHRRFDILAQVAGNSGLYQSNIKMLGRPAAQVALGGMWHIFDHYALRFGITEDIRADTAPDIGIDVSLIFKAFGKN
jgi:hypothetical protein